MALNNITNCEIEIELNFFLIAQDFFHAKKTHDRHTLMYL